LALMKRMAEAVDDSSTSEQDDVDESESEFNNKKITSCEIFKAKNTEIFSCPSSSSKTGGFSDFAKGAQKMTIVQKGSKSENDDVVICCSTDKSPDSEPQGSFDLGVESSNRPEVDNNHETSNETSGDRLGEYQPDSHDMDNLMNLQPRLGNFGGERQLDLRIENNEDDDDSEETEDKAEASLGLSKDSLFATYTQDSRLCGEFRIAKQMEFTTRKLKVAEKKKEQFQLNDHSATKQQEALLLPKEDVEKLNEGVSEEQLSTSSSEEFEATATLPPIAEECEEDSSGDSSSTKPSVTTELSRSNVKVDTQI